MSKLRLGKGLGKDAYASESVELKKKKEDSWFKKKRAAPAEEVIEDDEDLLQLKDIVANAASLDAKTRLESVYRARRALSVNKDPPISELISLGILPVLVQCLSADDKPDLQFEAAWALTNIASGTSEQTTAVVSSGAVAILIQLLRSPVFDVWEQALWALGNITGDGAESRNYAIALGIIDPLLGLLNKKEILRYGVKGNLAWIMRNLCQKKKPFPALETIRHLMPALLDLMTSDDTEVLHNTLSAIANLADTSNDHIEVVIGSGVVPRIVECLQSHDDEKIRLQALRALGNIVTGTDQQTQHVLDCGLLETFAMMQLHRSRTFLKEMMWTISNIAGGTQHQVAQLIDAGLIPRVISCLDKEEFRIQKEALYAIKNLSASVSKEQAMYVIQKGVIPPLCAMLGIPDAKVNEITLKALLRILRACGDEAQVVAKQIEECGGLEKIELLHNHDNKDISEQACSVTDTFFSGKELLKEAVEIIPAASMAGDNDSDATKPSG